MATSTTTFDKEVRQMAARALVLEHLKPYPSASHALYDAFCANSEGVLSLPLARTVLASTTLQSSHLELLDAAPGSKASTPALRAASKPPASVPAAAGLGSKRARDSDSDVEGEKPAVPNPSTAQPRAAPTRSTAAVAPTAAAPPAAAAPRKHFSRIDVEKVQFVNDRLRDNRPGQEALSFKQNQEMMKVRGKEFSKHKQKNKSKLYAAGVDQDVRSFKFDEDE
jgi:hypothetical protein